MSRKLLNLCLTALLCVVSTAAWALSEVNGVYQIGTAADLEEFAALVNGGQVYVNAELTADIDRGINGTMIGTEANEYQGFFDGKGHTIKINMYPEDSNAALFRYTGYRCVIQNLKVTGTITTSSPYAAPIVARNKAVVRGCYADVTINSTVAGDATHGGIISVGYGGTTVEDCLAKITIVGEATQNCGGVVGWAEKRVNIVNCLAITDGSTLDLSNGASNNISRNGGYLKVIDVETYNADPYANRPQGASYNNYVTNQWGNNVATTVVPYEDLADGRICYQLNNDQSRIAWVQTIGTDPFPVPAAFGQGQVFASDATGCDGMAEEALTYSNSGSDMAEKHTFDKYGVCTTCGCFDFHMFEFDDPTKFDKTDMSVLLGSVADVDKAEGWNRIANGFRLNMKMTNDITYLTEAGKYIFNPSDWIDGNFNGQGHAFTIAMTDMGEKAALFPEMSGNVENLIVHGSIVTGGPRWGSVSGNSRMALVRNVYSDVNITSTIAGDNTAGGFFGWMGDLEKTVENCIYAGNITLPEDAPYVRVGGFAGWANTKTYFKNCAVLGNITGAGDQSLQSATENSGNISRSWGNIVCENVYVVNPITGKDIADQDKYIHYDNEAGIADGELAFFLNGKQSGVERFFQVIGTDPEPMPFPKAGGLIYSASSSFRCDGTPLGGGGYTNDPSGEAVIPPHQFEDGWCTVCGQFDENFLTPVDGWFEVSDGAELAWWSNYANIHKDASVRLMDDIDMDGYMENFVPAQKFVGTFDGQCHTISNFVLETSGNYQGLIGTISDGAVFKNVILDETCIISGNAFCGTIGGTDGSGKIYIENVGFEGSVTTVNQNAACLVGVDQGGAMDMFITNCWITGTVNAGRESGAICGYSSGGSIVKNCWAAFTINQSGIYGSDSFTRGGATVINCYEADIPDVDPNKQQHIKTYVSQAPVAALPLDDIESGALTYNLNGKQFSNPSWYQTLGDDEHPYPFDNHGVVIFGAEQYFSIPNDDVTSVASDIKDYEQEAMESVIATQSLLDDFDNSIGLFDDVESFDDLAAALETVNTAKAAVLANADVYKAYIAKCEEIKEYLATHDDFEGDARTALENYLTSSDGVSDENPLGTYEFIVENHTATAEEIAAETQRVIEWLAEAISSGYVAGTDVSSLLVNSDFSQHNEGWTGGWANDWAELEDAQSQSGKVVGVEAWNTTGDMYQTVEDLKPGYYLVGLSAAFRPSNRIYSLNYAAGIYANGIFNYFPATVEDIVSPDDAQNGVNCNIDIKSAYDFPMYSDSLSTSAAQAEENGAVLLGYAVQGPFGMACAANADRYKAYTIARVGEDGKLTVGIKNPGTNYGRDWTGWGPIKMVYCGEGTEQEADAFDVLLENMSARANSILTYYKVSWETALEGPNFPETLRAELKMVVDSVALAETTAQKASLAAHFSDIFQTIYEAKQAYVELFDAATFVDIVGEANLALVEKDEETGEWSETGDNLFSEEEIDNLYDVSDAMMDGYQYGTYTIEQAQDAKNDPAYQELLPEQDEEGYYLIGNTKQFAIYRYIASEVDKYAKGKLIADVDMAGTAMLPIGHNKGENAVHIFAGVFDGQGHALTNVYIDDKRFVGMQEGDPATLFYELQNATVKNFKLTGEMYTSHQFSGAITRWMSGSSTIENCEIAVAMHFAENLAGDASSGGVIGRNGSANSLVKNCLVRCKLIGEGENPIWYVGGFAGWADAALDIRNTLFLNEFVNVGAEGDNSRTISRGTKCSPTNVFVSQYFRETEGTLVTPEQLASGEIAWKLNGSTGEDPHWFQTLGTDTVPHLFGDDVVYYYGGKYINEKPNPQLNAFAYNLDAKVVGENVVVNFDLNAEATNVEVKFYDGEALVCSSATPAATEYAAGANSIAVPVSEFGSIDPKTLSYEVVVTSKSTEEIVKVGSSYKVWGPYGMAINNNPKSKNFGQVLLAESYPQEITDAYISHDKPGAIYAFDPDFQPINAADGTPGFYGGLQIQGEEPLSILGQSYQFDLKDLRFTKDGRLFVARASGLSNSSVYEINPEDLDEPWKPLFTGGELDEETGITWIGDEEQNRMALSIAFDGAGEDLKMYVLGGQLSQGGNNFTDYNCSIYNIGTATEWAAAPSANFEPLDGVYTYSPVDVGIFEDGQGGLWYIQRRSDVSAEIPAIKHFDANGNEDYSDIAKTTVGGRIAATTSGDMLAIPTANGTVVLYETNYVPMENGKIFLNPKKTINVGESRITALAFDYADNLYVASASTETFSRYAIPSPNKVVATPGSGIGVGLNGDVNGDTEVNIADAQKILIYIANGESLPMLRRF